MSGPQILVRFGLITLGSWYLTRTVLSNILPPVLVHHPVYTALAFTAIIRLLDRYILNPYVYGSLRHVPTYYRRGLEIVTEIPRGTTPLKWFKEHPDADMIRMNDPLGEQRLFVASPAALRDIMSTYTYDFEKPWNIRAFLARVIGFGLILSEGHAHKKQRKALTPAFNIRNIRALYPLMWEKTGIMLGGLKKEMAQKGRIEMSAWASRLTLDIIGPSALSRDFQSLTSNDDRIADAFSAVLEPSPKMVAYLGLNLMLPQWLARRLPLEANSIVERECGFLRNVCGSILEEKHETLRKEKSAKAEETDILSNIIGTGEFTNDEIIDEMLTFLAAGHETTASALTWLCYLLCQDKQAQQKLRQEIRNTVSSSTAEISYDMLESMPYLNGVCEETLRLFPTVPTTIREAQRDTTVAGTVVPTGTLMVIPIYAINRNPRFWGENADKFTPERWISTGADGTQRVDRSGGTVSNFCETTFLHGQRSCIGRDFAKAELRCAVTGLIGKYNVEMVTPGQTLTIAGSVTTKPREGMHLILRELDGW